MANDLDDFDFAAALEAPLLPGQTLAGRRDREKKPLSRADRYKLQVTGRTKQLNLKVRPAMHAELMSTAQMKGKLPTEIVEEAWELYKATRGMDR